MDSLTTLLSSSVKKLGLDDEECEAVLDLCERFVASSFYQEYDWKKAQVPTRALFVLNAVLVFYRLRADFGFQAPVTTASLTSAVGCGETTFVSARHRDTIISAFKKFCAKEGIVSWCVSQNELQALAIDDTYRYCSRLINLII